MYPWATRLAHTSRSSLSTPRGTGGEITPAGRPSNENGLGYSLAVPGKNKQRPRLVPLLPFNGNQSSLDCRAKHTSVPDRTWLLLLAFEV
ncbi:hypothetical protein BaRGS_00039730 [Batillaria attramentaria]|uniref:Uncharacterized protein n=1 Tax=Batillaria attramentaria TaxID=370345 RepID=A0ABD0J2H4_9CAEN